MKNRTANYSFLAWILLLAIAASSCVQLVDTDPKKLIGRWRMSIVIHQGKAFSRPTPKPGRSEVEIEFFKNGEIEGTLPNDTFSGDYKIARQDSISIYCSSYSKVGEPEWGMLFYHNIRSAKTYSLRRDALNLKYKELYLNYDDGQLIFDRVNN